MPITFDATANLGEVSPPFGYWELSTTLPTAHEVPVGGRIFVWVLRNQLVDPDVPNTCTDPQGAYTLDASIDLPDTLSAPDGAPYDAPVMADGLGVDLFSRYVTEADGPLPAGSEIVVAEALTLYAQWGSGFPETNYLIATNTARTVNRGTSVGKHLNWNRIRSGLSDQEVFLAGAVGLRRDPSAPAVVVGSLGVGGSVVVNPVRTSADYTAIHGTTQVLTNGGGANSHTLQVIAFLRPGEDGDNYPPQHESLQGMLETPLAIFAACGVLAIYRSADSTIPTGRRTISAPAELGRVERDYDSPPPPPGEAITLSAEVAANTPVLLVTIENGTDLQTPTDDAGTVYRPLIFQSGPLLGPFVQLWHGQTPVALESGEKIYLTSPRRAMVAFSCNGLARSGANPSVYPLDSVFGGAATGVMQSQAWDVSSLAMVRAGAVYPRGAPVALVLGAVALHRGISGTARTFTSDEGWTELATFETDYGGSRIDLWVYWRVVYGGITPVSFGGTFSPSITNLAQANAQWDAVTALLWAGTATGTGVANLHTARGEYVVAYPEGDGLRIKRAGHSTPPFETSALIPSAANPALGQDPRTERLFLLYEDDAGGISQQHSDDDGETWTGEVQVFENGTTPAVPISNDRFILRAAFVETEPDGTGVIRAVAQEPGDATWGDEYNIVDAGAVETDLLFEPAGFSLSFAKDGPERLLLLAKPAGESGFKNFQSWDDGFAFTQID